MIYHIVSYARDFLYLSSSFSSVTLGTLASVTAKCTPNDEMTHVISVSTSISGVSLAYHMPETGTVTCLFFFVFFETDIGEEHVRKFKKNCSITLFSEESSQLSFLSNMS